jgi:hypothetical protein
MKLKLNENLSRHLKLILEEQSFDVLTVSDEGLFSLEQFVGCVVVVDPSRVRIRRPAINLNENE